MVWNSLKSSPATEIESLGASVRTIGAHLTHRADLTQPAGVYAAHEAIQAGGQPVDAIAINAGVGVGGDFWETDLDAEVSMTNLNCVSTVHPAKHMAQDMSTRGSGRTLFTASIVSLMPAPFEAV